MLEKCPKIGVRSYASDNYKEYQKNIKTLGNPVFSRAFFMSVFWRKKIYKYRKPLIHVIAWSKWLVIILIL